MSEQPKPWEFLDIVLKTENDSGDDFHLTYQDSDTSQKMQEKMEEEETLDVPDYEMSEVRCPPTQESLPITEPAVIQHSQPRSRLDVQSSEPVERDRSTLRLPNASMYNLRSKKKNNIPTRDNNFVFGVLTRGLNKGSNKVSKRGRRGKTITSKTGQTHQQKGDKAEVCMNDEDIPPKQQIILQQTNLSQASVPQTSIPQTILQLGSPLQTSTPQTSLLDTSLQLMSPVQMSTSQTSFQQTSTSRTSVQLMSRLQTSVPHTSPLQTNLFQTSPQHTNSPQTSSPQADILQTSLQQQTSNSQTSLLDTSLHNTSLPETSLQQTDRENSENAKSLDIIQQLFNGDVNALKFKWSSKNMFVGKKEKFIPEKTGPVRQFSNAYEAFRNYWDDGILDHIVTETNRNAARLKVSSIPFARDWYDTNKHEIMILFAFWIMLGVIQMPTLFACYSTNPLLKTEIFRILMTHSRYKILNRALSFVDYSTRTSSLSKLFYLGPIPEHLNNKFMESYIPDQNITIGESLTSWHQRLPFTQSVNNRSGIKTVELCDSRTGYLWSFLINTDKDTTSSTITIQKGTEIVVDLVKPLLNKGYNLFLGNWYVSAILVRYLKRNKTDCVGVFHQTRTDILGSIQNVPNLEGNCETTHCGDVLIVIYKSKILINIISTYFGAYQVVQRDRAGIPTRREPGCIFDYNTNKIEVQSKYHDLGPYMKDAQPKHWYIKLFISLLNASISNSYILRKGIQDVASGKDKRLQKIAFELELVNLIIGHHLSWVPKPDAGDSRSFPDVRFNGAHFITLPPLEEGRQKRIRRFCKWCTFREGKYSTTAYLCDQCNVPLCLKECFKKYHTIQ